MTMTMTLTLTQVHICAMVKLDLHSELFALAHGLVEEYPAAAVSWYAVDCYTTG
mgnify:CR=1 FL=1